jgi:hypothetical protein
MPPANPAFPMALDPVRIDLQIQVEPHKNLLFHFCGRNNPNPYVVFPGAERCISTAQRAGSPVGLKGKPVSVAGTAKVPFIGTDFAEIIVALAGSTAANAVVVQSKALALPSKTADCKRIDGLMMCNWSK